MTTITPRRGISWRTWDIMRDEFREAVLDAMDAKMTSIINRCDLNTPTNGAAGAQDVDLPALFKTLDDQLKKNLKAAGVTHILDTLDEGEVNRWNNAADYRVEAL